MPKKKGTDHRLTQWRITAVNSDELQGSRYSVADPAVADVHYSRYQGLPIPGNTIDKTNSFQNSVRSSPSVVPTINVKRFFFPKWHMGDLG